MKIVQAKPGDVDLLVPLFAAYLKFYKRPASNSVIRQFLAKRLGNRESVVFLALGTRHGIRALFGFVQLYPTFSSLSLKRLWILNDLFVAPQARRLGVATALLSRAERMARATHSEGLILETAVRNFAAQRLYENLGWRRDKAFYRYCWNVGAASSQPRHQVDFSLQ